MLVLLADHRRRLVASVEYLADLALDQAALFLDHEDEGEPLGEGQDALRFERRGDADLVEPQAEHLRIGCPDAEALQGLVGVEIALSGRNDADAGPCRPGTRSGRGRWHG
jgi:hypothetical protein